MTTRNTSPQITMYALGIVAAVGTFHTAFMFIMERGHQSHANFIYWSLAVTGIYFGHEFGNALTARFRIWHELNLLLAAPMLMIITVSAAVITMQDPLKFWQTHRFVYGIITDLVYGAMPLVGIIATAYMIWGVLHKLMRSQSVATFDGEIIAADHD